MIWRELKQNLIDSKYYYFHTDNGVLLCGDCLEVMKLIPNKNIDLVLTDPPYQISKAHNFDTMKDRKNERTGTYFGNWDKFDVTCWRYLIPLINKNGSILTFMSFEQYKDFCLILEQHDFAIKDRLIWEKTNPFPRNRDRRYIPNIELIVWATRKKAKWVFNKQNPKYETCVLRFPSESGARFKRFHPTQKPLALIEYLLKIHSNSDDLILDPFAGSSTVAVACEKLNRRWICIEINPEYCEISKERIQNILTQKEQDDGKEN